ncbi:phosphatase PAP2 family protein [Pontibaca salina]|uniref:Phosphatase PAP2 family protein n=1 Tax=Pontibaca salina TaxID=2795731 RepID=A0A934HK07_9RHOB|nr:phosphatase PAP2 family protein [Pontibaca salina]MBI6629599.1 phosphatase PAP2 family protein [Pontibaca salina]
MPLPTIVTDMFRRVETLTLIAILFVVGAIWAFAVLAGRVVNGDPYAFDTAILLALRQPEDLSNSIGGPKIAEMMRDFTGLGSAPVLTLIAFAVLVFLILRRQPATALFLAVAIVGGQALGHLAKSSFARPRPDIVPHFVDAVSASFPSGHSMMAAVTYLTLGVMLARTERKFRMRAFYISLAVVLSFLVGISRLFLGVHWPTDVLAGWTLGAAWALGVWLVARMMARHGQIETSFRADQ